MTIPAALPPKGSMRRTMPRSAATHKSQPARTAYQRAVQALAETWGVEPETARDRLNSGHSIYQLVKQANDALLRYGCLEKVADCMGIVEDSAAGSLRLPLTRALHIAQLADAEEEMRDETFRDRLRRGEATIEDAEAFIRASGVARIAALRAEREARGWIDEQRRKAATS